MKPGDDDLETWQGVVLVFVERLESRQRKKTQNLDKEELQGRTKPFKIVVGKELKLGERLPPSFASLTDSSGCEARACEHMHVGSGFGELLIDPWTLESRTYPDEFEVVSQESEETIIRVKNVETTLPTLLFLQNRWRRVLSPESDRTLHTKDATNCL